MSLLNQLAYERDIMRMMMMIRKRMIKKIMVTTMTQFNQLAYEREDRITIEINHCLAYRKFAK